MMKKFFMFVVALSLALVATSAFAQTTTTGSIEGMVTDPNGASVKGATVTATSPNLISAQTAPLRMTVAIRFRICLRANTKSPSMRVALRSSQRLSST
jgi:hypothetical protein